MREMKLLVENTNDYQECWAVDSDMKNEWRRDSDKRYDVHNKLLLQVRVKRHSSVLHPLGRMDSVIVDSDGHFRS